MIQPLVSIITINYNSLDYTLALIRSIQEVDYDNLEVIVVDNASKDDPSEIISKQYPEVLVYRSEVNLGFSGGNNKGIDLASGDFLFFVNNDTELTKNLISGLVNDLQENEEIGIVSPKIVYFNTDIVQYAGYNEVDNLTGRNSAVGTGMNKEGFNNLHKTAYAHGAAMMIPSKIVEECGKMPEEYFLYYEELDWSESIKRKGYEIWVDNRFEIYHKESMSVGKDNPLKCYYLTRNRILFFRRNKRVFENIVFLTYFMFAVLITKSFLMIIKGQFAFLKATWRGTLSHLTPS